MTAPAKRRHHSDPSKCVVPRRLHRFGGKISGGAAR
jgi:hypothetical protein